KQNWLDWPKKSMRARATRSSSPPVTQQRLGHCLVQHELKSATAQVSLKATPKWQQKNKTGPLYGLLTPQCSNRRPWLKPKATSPLVMAHGRQCTTPSPHPNQNSWIPLIRTRVRRWPTLMTSWSMAMRSVVAQSVSTPKKSKNGSSTLWVSPMKRPKKNLGSCSKPSNTVHHHTVASLSVGTVSCRYWPEPTRFAKSLPSRRPVTDMTHSLMRRRPSPLSNAPKPVWTTFQKKMKKT